MVVNQQNGRIHPKFNLKLNQVKLYPNQQMRLLIHRREVQVISLQLLIQPTTLLDNNEAHHWSKAVSTTMTVRKNVIVPCRNSHLDLAPCYQVVHQTPVVLQLLGVAHEATLISNLWNRAAMWAAAETNNSCRTPSTARICLVTITSN